MPWILVDFEWILVDCSVFWVDFQWILVDVDGFKGILGGF